MNFSTLKYDFPAWIAVFLVAVPLCLGIAVASGANPMAGIIAGMIWWIVVWLLSKSPLSVSGPAAWLVAIVLVAIWKLGFDQFLIALAIAGIFQIIFWLSKISKYAHYVPHTVIKGMLAAIGLTLIIKQTPTLLGSYWFNLNTIHIPIALIGFVCLGVIILREHTAWKKYKSIPGSLIAVLVGVVISLLYKNFSPDRILTTKQLVNLPILESVSKFSTLFHIPTFAIWRTDPQLYITALTIALVASIETILSIQAIDKLDPQERKTPLDRELMAQWVGNTISGLIGGLPITSVIVRSSVNLNSNGQSKLSAIIHGLFILITLLFGAAIINMIPMASLAAVLLITWYKLITPQVILHQWRQWWLEFIPFVLTIVIVIAEDLLMGVVAGIIVFYVLEYFFNKTQTIEQIIEEEDKEIIFLEEEVD